MSLFVALLLLACAKETPSPVEQPAAEVAPAAEAEPAAAAEVVLTGTVIQKPWSKSVESWNAGGSDYFVLDVAGGHVSERSADEGVILRPSASVTMEALAAAAGKKVEARGRYVAAEAPKEEPTGQYPMGPDGAPLPTGGGFEVSQLTVVP